MDLAQYCRAMAQYNAWMNRKIYNVCAELSDPDRKRDVGAFFRSIHGTLNHLLLTDSVQLGRFIGADRTKLLDERGAPIVIRSLDQELYSDFVRLRTEREKLDTLIEQWTNSLTSAELDGRLRYVAMADGREHEHPKWWAVVHMFNHQTHHRGQVTTLLKQLGRDPGVTDLMAFLRSEGTHA